MADVGVIDPRAEFERQRRELQSLLQIAENVTLFGFGDEQDNYLEMQLNDHKRNTHTFKIFQLTKELEQTVQEMRHASMLRMPLLKRKVALLKKQIEELKALDAQTLGEGRKLI